MSADEWVTLAALVVAIVTLATERFPTVIVLGAAVAVLLFVGVIDEQTALSGLSSSAPITIAALYVVAGAAAATGAFTGVVDRTLGKPGALVRLTSATAAMSTSIPNTPVVALLAPRVVRWSQRNGVSASRYLMPLSYASVLGGVVTLIGTSTNLVVSEVLVANGKEPLSMFEMTPAGLAVAVAGLVVLALIVPRLLPDRTAGGDLYGTGHGYRVVLRVEADGPLAGQSVGDASLRDLPGVYLAAIERDDRIIAATPNTVLQPGDGCVFVGDIQRVLDLDEIVGLVSDEKPHLVDLEQPGNQLYEVVISPQSELHGQTLKDMQFRSRYDAAVLAVRRAADDLTGKLGAIPLHAGDVLLVLADASFAGRWRQHSDFSLIASAAEPPPPRRSRRWLAIAVPVAMIILVATDVISLFEGAIAASAVLVAGGALSLGEARRAINVNVVLTVAVSISLGAAIESSGLHREFADVLLAVGEPFGKVGAIGAVLIATMLLTEVLSNNGAAAVMLPIGIAAATEVGLADPRAMAIAVLIGASCSFLTPIGYQTNLMVYGLGGYRFTDFTKVGLPLTLTAFVVTLTAIPLFWSL